VPSSIGASVSTLHHRAHSQRLSLRRWIGAERFFANRPALARSTAGRREVRRAHVWVKVIRRELAETVAALRPRASTVPQIICAVFRGQCAKALAVFGCESHYSVSARNGQYFGVAQMGERERARFGGSTLDPWEQVRAAYRYYLVSGWSPWSCA
jgi:hypothetical protein